jgi:uncharacterized membrane protein
MLPPIPSWDSTHVIIVHFPVALLIVAPLFVLLGAVVKTHRTGLQVAALLLFLIGTAGAYMAVASGEAAAQLAERTEETQPVITGHMELGHDTRLVFTLLTVAYAALAFGPKLLEKQPGPYVELALHGVFLALCLPAMLLLVNTGHLGGRLVHEFGVTAMYSEGSARGDPAPPAP